MNNDMLGLVSLLLNGITLATVLGVAFKAGRWAGRIEEKIATLEKRP